MEGTNEMHADPSWILQIALAVLGGGGLVGIISAFMSRKKISADAKKTNADAAKVFTDSALALVGPLHAQVDRLTKELAETHAESQRSATLLTNELAEARAQIAELRSEMDKMYKQIEYYQHKFGPPTPTGHIYPITGHKR